MKIPSSNLGRTCCVQKLFPTFRTISYSPCSAKRRASDKDFPVCETELKDNPIFLIFISNYLGVFCLCTVGNGIYNNDTCTRWNWWECYRLWWFIWWIFFWHYGCIWFLLSHHCSNYWYSFGRQEYCIGNFLKAYTHYPKLFAPKNSSQILTREVEEKEKGLLAPSITFVLHSILHQFFKSESCQVNKQQNPLLICTWFLKIQVWKVKFDELDFYSLYSQQKSISKYVD